MADDVRGVLAPWSKTAQELYERLGSSTSGLTAELAAARLKQVGPNEFKKQGKTNLLLLIARQLSNPLIFVLLGAAALTIFLDEIAETAVILLAVFVNTFLGFYQEYRAENAIEKLTAYIKERARTVRDGRDEEIDSAALVPGDVIRIASGGRVPADARITDSNSLSVDESFLTGESLPVRKATDAVSEGRSEATWYSPARLWWRGMRPRS
jgi:magnesium-transporting ATPase (P-type)